MGGAGCDRMQRWSGDVGVESKILNSGPSALCLCCCTVVLGPTTKNSLTDAETPLLSLGLRFHLFTGKLGSNEISNILLRYGMYSYEPNYRPIAKTSNSLNSTVFPLSYWYLSQGEELLLEQDL